MPECNPFDACHSIIRERNILTEPFRTRIFRMHGTEGAEVPPKTWAGAAELPPRPDQAKQA